jgi:hypothetical protein
MLEDNDYLLKYFFLYGIPERTKDILKFNYFDKNNNLSPIILSSYSAEGKTDLYEILQDQMNNNSYLKNNIFPKKATFLSEVKFPENIDDTPTVDIKENLFNQYIYEVSSFDQKKKHFCHCFQSYQSYIKKDKKIVVSILLNFAVLIFYENVTSEKELLNEKEEEKKSNFSFLRIEQYSNIYVPKALILVSDFPIFNLMIQILEKMYSYIKRKFTYFPMEQVIINCFEKMNEENNIKLNKEPFIPYCDLNIPFFFNLFNIKDIFLLAEFYLCSKSIIIACTNLEFLFPIYYILTTLFFPLNKVNVDTLYKLVVPDSDILSRTLFAPMAQTFELIYIEEKIDDNFLENICAKKGELLVYQILNDTKKEGGKDFIIHKTILKSEDKNGKININKININKYETIIEKICRADMELYKPLINKDIDIIKKEDDYKNHSFFTKNIDKQYEGLRNHLIGLFIKFFVIKLKPPEVEKLDGDKIQIKNIEFKELENDEEANDLLSNLYSTSQSDIIYKNTLIETGQFDNIMMKKIILLDYFIKISFIDKNRLYFEQKPLQDINKEEKIKELNLNKTVIKPKIKKPEKISKKNDIFNINELFDIIKLLTGDKNYIYYINRVYLYSLQNPNKTYFSINHGKSFIEDLKYYEELTKEKDIYTIKKDKKEKYIIFFGEKFELHFGQFVYKNLSKKEINYDFQKSEYEYLSKNKNYEKYYKATLDEAKIFYDLFFRQIIPYESKEELAACAIALYVLIYIINLLSELDSNNPYNEKIKQIIINYQDKLYQLLLKTKGFYGKFDFLLTLLYQVFSSKQIKSENQKKLCNLMMNCLSEEKNIPPILVILMNKHNIYMDFREIKKVIEKNTKIRKKNKINMTVMLSENQRSFYLNYEPIKEYLIYNIERIAHKHEYELFEEPNNDYICKEKCEETIGFKIQLKEGDNIMLKTVNNPGYIIIELLKKIIENKSFFIYSYGNLTHIYQIVMLDELYFKIGFFKAQQ